MAEKKTGVTIEAKATEECANEVASSLAETAVQAMHKGASDANAAAATLADTTYKLLTTATYGLGYYVSFGAVFSFLTVGSLLPTNSILSRAVSDGSEAAKTEFKKWQDRQVVVSDTVNGTA